jgi:endonuclease YncB( thermonuclease family)
MLGRYRTPIILLASFAVLFAFAPPSHAVIHTVEGIAKKVVDGDTITLVTLEGTKLRMRLYGNDAPEIRRGKMPG